MAGTILISYGSWSASAGLLGGCKTGLDFESIPILRVDSTFTPSSHSPLPVSLLQAVVGAMGLPVAILCVTLQWQEEPNLRFMKEVEMLAH